jgi:hypothetical protein
MGKAVRQRVGEVEGAVVGKAVERGRQCMMMGMAMTMGKRAGTTGDGNLVIAAMEDLEAGTAHCSFLNWLAVFHS